jgi:ABC-type sugar transport system permease subunit
MILAFSPIVTVIFAVSAARSNFVRLASHPPGKALKESLFSDCFHHSYDRPVVVGLIWRYLFDANFGLIIISFNCSASIQVWLGTPAWRFRLSLLQISAVDALHVYSFSPACRAAERP